MAELITERKLLLFWGFFLLSVSSMSGHTVAIILRAFVFCAHHSFRKMQGYWIKSLYYSLESSRFSSFNNHLFLFEL